MRRHGRESVTLPPMLTNDFNEILQLLPEPIREARMAFGRAVRESGLEFEVRELLRLRSAQLQNCRH